MQFNRNNFQQLFTFNNLRLGSSHGRSILKKKMENDMFYPIAVFKFYE